MKIEPFGIDDLAGLDGFDLPEWGDLVAAQRYHLDDPICHPYKLVSGGEIVGIGTATDLSPSGWLSYIAVRPDLRRRGIGGRMVDALVRFLREERACRNISLVSTDLGRSIYDRAGFRVMTEYVVLETDLPIFGFQPHSDHIRPCELQDAGQVLAMDLEICGEDRGSVLRKRMGSAYVFLAETLVQGIFFPDLGDGVIEAVTPRAGLELVRFKAMAAKSATVPRENTVAMEYLWDQGFRETSRRTRMILGEPLRWRPDCVYGL